MDRISRRVVTRNHRQHHQAFLETNQPDDEQQIDYLRTQFPNRSAVQIFQIFQILNNREHPHAEQNFENLQEIRNDHNLELNPNQEQNIMAQAAVNNVLFVDDPYQGNINPGTTDGAKLYLKATAAISDEDKFDLSITTAQKFLDLMRRDANNFGWGRQIRAIQQEDASTTKNLLKDHKVLTEAHLKKQAYKTWGNWQATFDTAVPDTYELQVLDPAANPNHRPPFFRRVRSRMIAKRIIGHLKTADFEILKNQSAKYTWFNEDKEEMDRPTMLWILFQACNPSTRVGVSELKTDLRNATSSKFQHDVKKLTNYMSSKYREIEEKGQKHEDYQLDLFNALQTVPNPDFAAFIRDERQAWEIGGNKTTSQIIAESLTIYNNAVSANRWENKDPKDTKIMALTTQVEQLVEAQKQYTALATKAKTAGAPNNNDSSNPGDYLSIKVWRMKKTEDEIKKDGKTWYWCPHHKLDGAYDGLYVTHKPEEHEEWKKNKFQFRRNKWSKAKQNTDSEEKDEVDGKKLTINDNLKAALLTHCDLSGDQIDELLEDARSHADF